MTSVAIMAAVSLAKADQKKNFAPTTTDPRIFTMGFEITRQP